MSHTTAATLWDLPLPRTIAEDGLLHVTSIAPRNAMARVGVVGHVVRSELAVVRTRWGMRTSSPATTWIECGSLLALDDLIALGDAIVTKETCRTTIDDLRLELARRSRCRGAKRLHAALELVRVGAGSPKETEVRLLIVRAGFMEPSLQVTIHDELGRFVGRVDMAYPHHRLIVEYEGDHHRTDEEQWARDIRRYRTFDRLGWFTMRLTKRDLDDHLAETLELLAERLGVRSRRGPERRPHSAPREAQAAFSPQRSERKPPDSGCHGP